MALPAHSRSRMVMCKGSHHPTLTQILPVASAQACFVPHPCSAYTSVHPNCVGLGQICNHCHLCRVTQTLARPLVHRSAGPLLWLPAASSVPHVSVPLTTNAPAETELRCRIPGNKGSPANPGLADRAFMPCRNSASGALGDRQPLRCQPEPGAWCPIFGGLRHRHAPTSPP